MKISVILGQTVPAQLPRIAQKLAHLVPDFQGHSRSLEQTRIDRQTMTSHQWSIYSNHGSYRFRDKRRFR